MHIPAFPARCLAGAILVAAGLFAQSPLATPFTGTTNTSLAGVCYFDLTVTNPAGITVTALDLHCGSTTGQNGFVTVWSIDGSYQGNTADPSPWLEQATVPVTSAGPGAITRTLLGSGFHLPAGLHGIAIAGAGITQRFTFGGSCTSTSTPGSCVNSLFQNADLVLAAGATTTGAFSGPTASPRVWNGALHYLVGNTSAPAADASPFGLGSYASAYQFFPDAAAASAALQGRSLRFVPANGTYRLEAGNASLLPLPANTSPVFATPTDDGATTVTLPAAFPTPDGPVAQLHVHSNGLVGWGPTPIDFGATPAQVPTPAAFLALATSAVHSWADYRENEPGSGRIVQSSQQFGPTHVFCVTWNDVEHASATPLQNRSTVQFQFNLTTGVITIVWHHLDTDTSTGSTAHLVGFSPGGPSRDGGAIRLASDLPLTLATGDLGTRLRSNVPRLGTTWLLTSEHHAAGSPIGLVMFGTQAFPAAGIDLGPVGAAGSRAYQSGDLGAFVVTVPGGTGSHAVFVPFQPALLGATLHAQTLGFTTANGLGLAPSNGLTGRIGW